MLKMIIENNPEIVSCNENEQTLKINLSNVDNILNQSLDNIIM